MPTSYCQPIKLFDADYTTKSQTQWQTVQIFQKPSDLDLHNFKAGHWAFPGLDRCVNTYIDEAPRGYQIAIYIMMYVIYTNIISQLCCFYTCHVLSTSYDKLQNEKIMNNKQSPNYSFLLRILKKTNFTFPSFHCNSNYLIFWVKHIYSSIF